MCERVIAAVDRGGALPSRVRARIEAGRLLSALSLFDSARAQFSQAEYIAGDRTDLLHQALVASAELASQKGDFRSALATLQRVTNLPAKATDKAEEHKLFLSLAHANAATGNAVAARGFLDRADALGIDGPAACERERMRGYIAYFARDFRGAAAYAERACDLAREHAISHEVALDLHDLGDALERIGDYPRAYGALKQSLAMCEEAGFDRLANHDRMFIGYLDAVAGDKEAERALVNGIALAEANAYTWDLLGGRRLLAKLHLHRGEKETARKELERVKSLANETGNGLAADEAMEALLAL
jgi:tetratricopeptide (TPR) repeat protein